MSQNDLVYFSPHFDLETGVPGVREKILCQAKVFSQRGWQVHLVGWRSFSPPLLCGSFPQKLCRFNANMVLSVIDDWRCYQRAFEQIQAIKPGVVFIRYRYFSLAFVRFLKRLKSLSSVPKVVMEIPTWPYDNERTPLDLRTWEDLYCRHKLPGLIDRIMTFTDHNELLGISTIKTRNGINVDAVPYQGPAHFEGSRLELIAVSNLVFWNGYDRILHGLAAYASRNQQTEVSLTVVGDGPALPELQRLTRELKLDNSVHFTGRLQGDKLASAFNSVHIAVGNLGVHRKNMFNNPDLKNRDYCARGIPFVTSTRDDSFPAEFPFLHYVAADDSPLDIPAIVAFYRSIKAADFSEMRNFSEINLDWHLMMQPVLKYLDDTVA